MKLKVIFISIAPPENYCGVRVVMYRHLIERDPFELLVATNADYQTENQPHLYLTLPYLIQRIKKSRFGPFLRTWINDFENLIWPLLPNRQLDKAISEFKPDILLFLADNSLGEIACRTAKRHNIPLAGLFLDWTPIMDGYYGHTWSQKILNRRFRRQYQASDVAFCTSEGMQKVLGFHKNSHVIYPMPGQHAVNKQSPSQRTHKFRLVYVGSVQNFYGRMLCSLIQAFDSNSNLEIIIVGPNADWPSTILKYAQSKGIYLGFLPSDKAAEILVTADALLVVMSFEEKYKLFMETSFTTKFLDYAAFKKPIIVWGPEYCSPVMLAKTHGGAIIHNQHDPESIVTICQQLADDQSFYKKAADEANNLHTNLFNPTRLQDIFVEQINLAVSHFV